MGFRDAGHAADKGPRRLVAVRWAAPAVKPARNRWCAVRGLQ